MFPYKRASYRIAVCPMCQKDLGTFDSNYLHYIKCNECEIKWAWRPKEDKPIALDYPGKRAPEKCECYGCEERDARKGH